MLCTYVFAELQINYNVNMMALRHYAIAVRDHVDDVFNVKASGRQRGTELLPRSLDLTPMEFFFLGLV